MLYQIYLITNLLNNKKYVGQTRKSISYLNRFKQHINESKPNALHTSLLHKAIMKYGEENFKVELVEDNICEDDIDNKEIYYIGFYDTLCLNNHGYNMTIGGQGVHGYRHSKKTKLKISSKSKAYWKDLRENNKQKYNYLCEIRSLNLRGRSKSEETKKKCSKAAKIRFKNNPGTFKGKKHTEETKQKIALANGCQVAMLDIETNEIICIFNSATEAAKYLIKQGKTTNKYANARIFEICCGNGKTAYGYR